MNFIREVADEKVAGIRLDSVCFPREGVLRLPNMTEAYQKRVRTSLSRRVRGRTDMFLEKFERTSPVS